MLSNNFRWNSFRHNEVKGNKLDWVFDALWFVVTIYLLYNAIVNDDIIVRIVSIAMFVLAVSMLISDIVMRWVHEDILEGEYDIRSEIWQMKYSYNKILFMENPWTNRTKKELEEEFNKLQTKESDKRNILDEEMEFFGKTDIKRPKK